jgi:uncharacterized glyoxalase superfamily protein PhnB
MAESAVALGQTIFPALRYLDARAAIAWLEKTLGAASVAVYDADDGTVSHAEVLVAGNVVMLGTSRNDSYGVRSPKEVSAVTGGMYVVLPDAAAVDALHERAAAAGATVAEAPYDTDYGSHEFRITDPEDYPWTFGTYRPQV